MMKYYFPLICIFLALTSCGPDKKSPEYITEQYLLAVKAKNWELAKKYSEQSNIDAIDCIIRMGEERADILEIKDIDCEIKDDHASCFFCCTTYGRDGQGQENLVKINGEWKVVGMKEQCPDQDPEYKKESKKIN